MDYMGPFKLESVLGRGGMGTVYRALNSETNEILALKVLSPGYSQDSHFRNRFESEIKALLKLDHPNVVRLVSYGRYEHNLYFAMELVEGQSLFQMQRDGAKFQWREVIRIAKNVALGLRHAHDRGVIHRDLKPGNLLKAFTGIIKITDFGIAKSFGHNQDTGTNVLGTVDFMSPEQAKGQPVTFRSDLYSLGAVMYTLLGGQPPFTGNSVEESMRNLTKVPAPRITRIAPDVPKALDDLIANLLEKDPEKRIQTALSLYHQLKQAEQQLKDSSEALTAERPSGSNTNKTSLLAGPITSIEEGRASARTVPHEIEEANENESDSTCELVEEELTGSRTGKNLIKPEESGVDYFTTVTENERLEHLEMLEEEEEAAPASGILVISLLLLAVIAAAAYGIYKTNQIPPANELYAQIEQEWEQPQKRFGAIQQFLENYPDHENRKLVEGRLELARAFHKLVQLRGKRAGKKDLSEVETKFLGIIDGQSSDLKKQAELLDAMITLYQNNESLQGEDSECIAAAKAYLEPLQRKAEEQMKKIRSDVENQLERAKTLTNAEAVKLYDSILELNKEFDWLTDLLDETKSRRDALQ